MNGHLFKESFLPSLFGLKVDTLEADMMRRPSRYGGIGILDPVKSGIRHYSFK